MLTKVTVETALNAELDEHLGYEKHSPINDSNSRNSYSSKRLITDDGEIQLETLVTVTHPLNLSSFVSIKLDFNRWTTRS